MTGLVLVRHGQTDWNLEGRYQGHADRPLNESGRAQAREQAEKLVGQAWEAIYSSDLLRAYETATIIAGRLGLTVRSDPRLREICMGEWEGLLVAEITERYPDQWKARYQEDPVHSRPPGGETVAEVAARVWAALDDIAIQHPSGPVLVVSHGLALASVLCRAQQLPLTRIFTMVPKNAHPIEVSWVVG